MTDTISVGGTMFDDAILSQPPTPQNLVEVLGWVPHEYRKNVVTARNDGWIRLSYYEDFCNFRIEMPKEWNEIPPIPTLRDVVDLCRLLGIPCEVKR